MKKRFSKYDKEFLRSCKIARLATISPDGSPHVIPLWYLYIENRIYMATDKDSKKVRNIQRNPKVAVLFDAYEEEEKFGQSSWDIKGLMIPGTAEIIESGKMYNKFFELLPLKYPVYHEEPWEKGEAVVIEVKPEEFCDWETEDVFEKELEELERVKKEVKGIKNRLKKIEEGKNDGS